MFDIFFLLQILLVFYLVRTHLQSACVALEMRGQKSYVAIVHDEMNMSSYIRVGESFLIKPETEAMLVTKFLIEK